MSASVWLERYLRASRAGLHVLEEDKTLEAYFTGVIKRAFPGDYGTIEFARITSWNARWEYIRDLESKRQFIIADLALAEQLGQLAWFWRQPSANIGLLNARLELLFAEAFRCAALLQPYEHCLMQGGRKGSFLAKLHRVAHSLPGFSAPWTFALLHEFSHHLWHYQGQSSFSEEIVQRNMQRLLGFLNDLRCQSDMIRSLPAICRSESFSVDDTLVTEQITRYVECITRSRRLSEEMSCDWGAIQGFVRQVTGYDIEACQDPLPLIENAKQLGDLLWVCLGSLKDLQLLSMIDQFAMNLRQKDPEKFLGTTLFELTARSNVISLCIMDRFRDICTISGSDFLTIQGQAHGPEELALGFYQSVAAQMQRQSRTSLASAEKIMELFVSHNGDLFADNIDSTEMELLDRGMKWQKLDAIRSSLPL